MAPPLPVITRPSAEAAMAAFIVLDGSSTPSGCAGPADFQITALVVAP